MVDKMLLPTFLAELLQRILDGGETTREDAEQLISSDVDIHDLMYAANKVRHHFKGDKIELCSIINAKSGRCRENCAFCSQSAHHDTDVPVHDLVDTEQIVACARDAQESGAGCFGIVTASPGVSDKDVAHFSEAIKKMNEEGLSIRRSGSLGMMSEEHARQLRAAGMTMIHHNLETSARFFPSVCTTHTYEERLATLKNARAAGMKLCSGAIFGMGEEWADRLDVFFTLRDLEIDSIPLNFLNPIKGTPLQDIEPIKPLEALRCIALGRMILPTASIRVCGGREVNLRDLQSWIFYAGANGLMVGNYLTTTGRLPEVDLQMLRDLGLEPVVAPGK
jgi:biotin synthase